jgi:hypothetical protein
MSSNSADWSFQALIFRSASSSAAPNGRLVISVRTVASVASVAACAGELRLAATFLGDVGEGHQQPAAGQRQELEIDVEAVRQAALVAQPAGTRDGGDALGVVFLEGLVGIGVVAAIPGIADEVLVRPAVIGEVARNADEVGRLVVPGAHPHLRIEQRRAHRQVAHQGAHGLGVGLDRGERLGELGLAALELGDVAIGGEPRIVGQTPHRHFEDATIGRRAHIAAVIAAPQRFVSPLDFGFRVVELPELAAPRQIAQHTAHAAMSRHRLGCQVEEGAERFVVEQQRAVRRVERDAVAHVVEHALHDAARLGEVLFARLKVADVTVHRQHAAVRQRLEVEVDPAAAGDTARVTTAAGRLCPLPAIFQHRLDVVGRSEIAALDLEAQDVFGPGARARDFARDLVEVAVLLVRQLDMAITIEQHDAVVHVVEHELQAVADRLGLVARRGELLLAFLQLADVAIHRQQTTTRQMLEVEVDPAAARGLARVAVAARLAHHRDALLDHLLEIVDRPEIAAQRLEADDVLPRSAGIGDLRREALELHELAVDHLPAEIGVEQHETVVHVVEHDLQTLARRFELTAIQVCFLDEPMVAVGEAFAPAQRAGMLACHELERAQIEDTRHGHGDRRGLASPDQGRKRRQDQRHGEGAEADRIRAARMQHADRDAAQQGAEEQALGHRHHGHQDGEPDSPVQAAEQREYPHMPEPVIAGPPIGFLRVKRTKPEMRHEQERVHDHPAQHQRPSVPLPSHGSRNEPADIRHPMRRIAETHEVAHGGGLQALGR